MFIEEPIENCMLYSLGEGRSWDQAVVASAIWLHDGLTRYRDLEERRADMVDPQPSQNLAEEVLKILAEGDDPEVGTKLLVHLQFDKFSLIKCLLRSRLKVVWCTCLAKAEVGNAVGASAIWPHDALARDRDLEERRAYLVNMYSPHSFFNLYLYLKMQTHANNIHRTYLPSIVFNRCYQFKF